MNLIELRLQKILQENRKNFIDSLQLSGIDAEHGIWTVDAVDKNAQAGALSLIQFASQKGISDRYRNKFLRTVAENLDEAECYSVLAWLHTGYIWTRHFPPYTIIQHMINPVLLREYCAALQKYLHLYLQGYLGESPNIV